MIPFNDKYLSQVLNQIRDDMLTKIDCFFTNDVIMANDLNLLADNLYNEFFVQPVTIHDEDFSKRKIEQTNVKKNIYPVIADVCQKDYVVVDGLRMIFFFPFEGDQSLFQCRATTYSLSPYRDIKIENGYIILSYDIALQDIKANDPNSKKEIMYKVEKDLEDLRYGIGWVNDDVNIFNSKLRELALSSLRKRKENIESYYTIAKLFEVPVNKTAYAEKHIPMKRNILPIAHDYNKEPFYCISDTDYLEILETIKHTASTYERTPSSYSAMHEEDLRNTLLATLNATYKGDATGESFRNHGKTDICIERENRAAFVAECKMWTGKKAILSAIEQLDSYLTWRDCKTALIYFVRKKNFLNILSTAEATLKEVNFMRQVESIDKNEFKCVFISQSNPGQLVQLRVMLFNLFSD